MSHRRAALYLFVTILTLVPSSAVFATGFAADQMCNPYDDSNPQCKCGMVPDPKDKSKCVKGANTYGCEVGICFDDTNDHITKGKCVAKNKCLGILCDGKPCAGQPQGFSGQPRQTGGEGVGPATQTQTPTTGGTNPSTSGGNTNTPSGSIGPNLTPTDAQLPNPLNQQAGTDPWKEIQFLSQKPISEQPGLSGGLTGGETGADKLPGFFSPNSIANMPQAGLQPIEAPSEGNSPANVPSWANSYSPPNTTGFGSPSGSEASGNLWNQIGDTVRSLEKPALDFVDNIRNWYSDNISNGYKFDETANLTAYGVCEGMAGGCNEMEGAPTTAVSHLDENGQPTNKIYTLNDYANGKVPYVTTASSPDRFGETGVLNQIKFTDPITGETKTLNNVPYEVADTGGRFPNGTSKMDVPLTVPEQLYGNNRAINNILDAQPFSGTQVAIAQTNGIMPPETSAQFASNPVGTTLAEFNGGSGFRGSTIAGTDLSGYPSLASNQPFSGLGISGQPTEFTSTRSLWDLPSNPSPIVQDLSNLPLPEPIQNPQENIWSQMVQNAQNTSAENLNKFYDSVSSIFAPPNQNLPLGNSIPSELSYGGPTHDNVFGTNNNSQSFQWSSIGNIANAPNDSIVSAVGSQDEQLSAFNQHNDDKRAALAKAANDRIEAGIPTPLQVQTNPQTAIEAANQAEAQAAENKANENSLLQARLAQADEQTAKYQRDLLAAESKIPTPQMVQVTPEQIAKQAMGNGVPQEAAQTGEKVTQNIFDAAQKASQLTPQERIAEAFAPYENPAQQAAGARLNDFLSENPRFNPAYEWKPETQIAAVQNPSGIGSDAARSPNQPEIADNGPRAEPVENPPLPKARPDAAGALGIKLATCGGVCEVGNTGNDVKAIQQFLNTQKGNNIPVDGIYGPKTEAAIESFQKANSIAVDGMAGPQTLAKMNEIASLQNTSAPTTLAQTQQYWGGGIGSDAARVPEQSGNISISESSISQPASADAQNKAIFESTFPEAAASARGAETDLQKFFDAAGSSVSPETQTKLAETPADQPTEFTSTRADTGAQAETPKHITGIESQKYFGASGELTPEQAKDLNKDSITMKGPDAIKTQTITDPQDPRVTKAENAIGNLGDKISAMKSQLDTAINTGKLNWQSAVSSISSAQNALEDAKIASAHLGETGADKAAITAASAKLSNMSDSLNELKGALSKYSTDLVVGGMQSHAGEIKGMLNSAQAQVKAWDNALPDPPTHTETITISGKTTTYNFPPMTANNAPPAYMDYTNQFYGYFNPSAQASLPSLPPLSGIARIAIR